MTEQSSAQERLHELVIQRTLEGITLDEALELNLLSDQFPDVDLEGIEAAVAALDAVPFGTVPPLPESIASAVATRLPGTPKTSPAAQTSSLAWPWIAAAAMLLVAALGWYRALIPQSDVPSVAETAVVRKVTDMPDMGRWDFDATQDPAGQNVSGEVRWSPAMQRGEMSLVGLPVNNPAVEQYQLWVFDATRSDAHPVDGGVFDVHGVDPNLVAIVPTLRVRQPTLWAITVETPGGVMVSSRERIVAMAHVR